MSTRRTSALRERHAQLERALEGELLRPLPDSLRVRSLKRRKLLVKDELLLLHSAQSPG